MQIEHIKSLFLKHKADNLFGRYITNSDIKTLINHLDKHITTDTIGKSVLNAPIYSLKIGNGTKRILMWSQMHGNESTTTKALFDLLNTLLANEKDVESILRTCTLYIIPILNPDGAKAYTRVNANKVDLNRDAQALTQPESKVLRHVFETFKPHFCFNLHGQRTIFSAGVNNKSAIVSFLAPAQDQACTVTPNRTIAMEVIAAMNKTLQEDIPNQVGVYDDAFNINCVGDTFQSTNTPTILFEAGHYPNDYNREKTRLLIYTSYISSLLYISNNEITGKYHKPYFDIPENEKCFFDIIIRNTNAGDVAIQYKEKLVGNKIEFIPTVDKIDNLEGFYGHLEIDASGNEVIGEDGELLKIASENVFVIIKSEKILLLPK